MTGSHGFPRVTMPVMSDDRIDHTEPLPPVGERPPGRWATPYITYVDGQQVHACALRMDVHLTTREILGGCLTLVYGETPEELQRAMDRQDKLSKSLRSAPPLWADTGSGSGAAIRDRSGGAAGSSVGT